MKQKNYKATLALRDRYGTSDTTLTFSARTHKGAVKKADRLADAMVRSYGGSCCCYVVGVWEID